MSAELDGVEANITNVAEAARKHYESVQGKRKEINELRGRQQDIIFRARQEAQKEGYEKNAKRNEIKTNYEITKREAENYNMASENGLSDIRYNIQTLTSEIANLSAKVEAKRNEWNTRNAEEYKVGADGLICPIYETLCSDASVLRMDAIAKEKVRAKFEDSKAADLRRITEEGKALNDRIADKKARLQELEAQLSERMEAIAAKKAEYAKKLQDLEAELAANPEVTVSTDITPEDLPEWQKIEARIAEISNTISEIPAADTSELTAKKRELTALLDGVKEKLGIRTTIEKNTAKKAEIAAREKELAQQQADLEKQEFTIDELNKARMDEVERRVNDKFQNVRFRMFEPQLNGGETPTCIAMVDGVKYADLNTAGKINAGLDIINTLCLFHGISAPVFIDNAESVNQLFPVASQLIKLVVTTDKQLTITHL